MTEMGIPFLMWYSTIYWFEAEELVLVLCQRHRSAES